MTIRLTIGHCRSAGWCVSGIRRRCRELGFDFKTFVREGIPISELEGKGDALLDRAVAIAKEEGARRGQ